jgi:exodeoxyribonuclease V alpha subunit
MSFPQSTSSNLIEITATYRGERFRFAAKDPSESDTVVAEVLRKHPGFDNADVTISTEESLSSFDFDDADEFGTITVKGPADLDELRDGLEYRFYGKWTTYKNKRSGRLEKQFTFQTFTLCTPHNRTGIIKYLQTAPNVGTARARKLWETFGADAVRVAREEPAKVVATLSGVSIEKANEAAKYLEDQSALENCSIDLVELLEGRGFPKSLPKKVLKTWGNCGVDVIRRNPYALMAFRNCGFKRCDSLYLQLQLPPGKLKRQALSAWYSIASNTEGHTWHPIQTAIKGIGANVAGANLEPEKALTLAKRAKMLEERIVYSTHNGLQYTNGTRWIAEAKKARSERTVASYVVDAMQETPVWDAILQREDFLAKTGPDGEEHQRERIAATLQGVIGILGGSPGTGKTYTAAAVIRTLITLYGAGNVAVAGPTGKSAVRVTEAMHANGVQLRARTIHSLLGVAQAAEDGDRDGTWGFTHNEKNPLPFKFIVVDESSMIDTDLMRSLLAARAKDCHILLLGDICQLPPVGHGAPLRDMIAAGVAYGELREIRRNSGRIVKVCAQIRDKQRWNDSAEIDISAGENLKVMSCDGTDEQINTMLWAVRHAEKQGLNPVWDCQIIVPVNAKSKLSRKELNKVLQTELNASPAVAGSQFRTGDKIVNLKNGFFEIDQSYWQQPKKDNDEATEEVQEVQQNDKGEVFVANGELAEVLAADESLTVAKLTNPLRIIKIPKGKSKDAPTAGSDQDNDSDEKTSTGCSWDLGYALSCHKSQGSEWPVAIVMLDEYPGAKMVCSREWIYTAISRAKKLCLLIGKKATADSYCRKSSLAARKTFLKELILEERELRRQRAIQDNEILAKELLEIAQIAQVEQQDNVVSSTDNVTQETTNSEASSITPESVQVISASDWLAAIS